MQQSITRAVLVGHSMGGAIALTEALRNPAICTALVLVGSGAKLRVGLDMLTMLPHEFAIATETIVKALYRGGTDAAILRRALRQLRAVDPQVLYGDFLACDRFDVIDQLQFINIPTLLIVGDQDELTPVKYSEYLHAHLAKSELEVIDGAGHMVMLEQPKKLNSVLERYLYELDL